MCCVLDHVVGTLLPGVEGRLRTIDGIPLSKEQVGELHVRGRNVMRGYLRAPDLTDKVIDSEGWFNTGYVARFEGDCLYILGRTKEMIGALSAKIEAILNSRKDVQSAVIGRGLNGDGELVAFVQPSPGSRVKATHLIHSIEPWLTAYIPAAENRRRRCSYREAQPARCASMSSRPVCIATELLPSRQRNSSDELT